MALGLSDSSEFRESEMDFGLYDSFRLKCHPLQYKFVLEGVTFPAETVIPVQKLTESRHGTNQSPPSSDSCEAQHTQVLAALQVLVMAQEATTDAYSVAIPTVLHAPSGVPRTLTPPLPIPPPSIPTQEEGRGVSNRDNESWCEGG